MDYKSLTKKYHKEFMESLTKFVSINSVYDPLTKDEKNPFGKGVTKALNFIYELAKKDGFIVKNYDNMIVEILTQENIEKNVTIMGHADVVPTGDGWDRDPFKIAKKNGLLMARGVADDKGPVLASYYAMKALRDEGLLKDIPVRLLVGGNEENGSLGVEHYFKDLKKVEPALGFSPDSNFPLIYAEKELANFEVKLSIDKDEIISINGGVASNSVIEKCVALVKYDEKLKKELEESSYKYDCNEKGELLEIIFYGKAAHGSVPWEGDNAGISLIGFLAGYYDSDNLRKVYNAFKDSKGRYINGYYHNEEMGDNSFNVGLINTIDRKLLLVVNSRYINGIDVEKILKDIEASLVPFKMEIISRVPLLYYPKDSVLVSTLLKAYQDESLDYFTPPLTTGGGTYAKETTNLIAFGCEFPGFDCHMHAIDECIKEEDLYLGMAIYARAILELGKKI